MLLVGQIPSQRVYDDEEKPETDKIQMVADINDVKDRIKSAKEPIDVVTAYAELNAIYGTLVEIRSTSYGRYSHDSKLDNLTLNNDRRHFHSDKTREARTVYDSSTVKAGKPAPWNNLTEIAKHDEITEKCVISLLQADGITDYRLTHDIPYVKIGHKSCHKIDDEGVISKESVPDYEIEFALKREEVLKAYAYIKDYFDNEEQYIQQTCEDTLGVEDRHFKQFEETSEVFNRRSIADNRLYHLISVFNSLPDRDLQERTWKHSNVFSLISDRYQAQNKIPGTNKKGEQKISEDLFKFDNPIFQEHFGEDFKQSLIAKKEVYQQRLFETTFNVAKKLPAMWLAARDRLQHLNEKDDSLDDRIDGLLEGKRRRKLLKKRKEVRNELSFYRGKEDLLKTVTLNYYCSVLEKSNSWYHFSRLTPVIILIFLPNKLNVMQKVNMTLLK